MTVDVINQLFCVRLMLYNERKGAEYIKCCIKSCIYIGRVMHPAWHYEKLSPLLHICNNEDQLMYSNAPKTGSEITIQPLQGEWPPDLPLEAEQRRNLPHVLPLIVEIAAVTSTCLTTKTCQRTI